MKQGRLLLLQSIWAWPFPTHDTHREKQGTFLQIPLIVCPYRFLFFCQWRSLKICTPANIAPKLTSSLYTPNLGRCIKLGTVDKHILNRQWPSLSLSLYIYINFSSVSPTLCISLSPLPLPLSFYLINRFLSSFPSNSVSLSLSLSPFLSLSLPLPLSLSPSLPHPLPPPLSLSLYLSHPLSSKTSDLSSTSSSSKQVFGLQLMEE